MKDMESSNRRRLLGVISDTHGLLRPEVAEVFKDVELIIHCGDVGGPKILGALSDISPVVAVKGNMDWGEWSLELKPVEIVDLGEVVFYVLHDLYNLDLTPEVAGFSAVLSGHTHRPSIKTERGVLYLNPGSAGPVRKDLPVSVALLHIMGNRIEAEIVELDT